MQLDNRKLGTIAIVASPLMLAEFILSSTRHLIGGEFGPADAVIGLIYLAGFFATLMGLRTLRITGSDRWTTILFGVQVALLLLAALQQVLELAGASTESAIFGLADAAWPFSHMLMCVTGIAILRARRWTDYRRYLPFLCGFAVPALIAFQLLSGKGAGRITFGLLTLLGFGLLGYSLRSSSPDRYGETVRYV